MKHRFETRWLIATGGAERLWEYVDSDGAYKFMTTCIETCEQLVTGMDQDDAGNWLASEKGMDLESCLFTLRSEHCQWMNFLANQAWQLRVAKGFCTDAAASGQ